MRNYLTLTPDENHKECVYFQSPWCLFPHDRVGNRYHADTVYLQPSKVKQVYGIIPCSEPHDYA